MADDEQKLLIDRDRGAKAAALLENPLLTEAFDELEAAYVAAWKDSPAGDRDARERAWTAVRIIIGVRAHLEKVVTNGSAAAVFLADLHPNKL